MTITSVELSGLDPQNPLAFLAALGLLRVLDDAARANGGPLPRLRFRQSGRMSPIVDGGPADPYALTQAILADAKARAASPALRLAYDDSGKAADADARGASRDLKPVPALARQWLADARNTAVAEARLAGAFLSDAVQDNNGASKPTAFHFTAGQQEFLRMVEDLRTKVTAKDVEEALVGPWVGTSKLPSLSWDSTASRSYALRAGDPSKEKRGSVAAANWLGVLGLSFFPVFPVRGRLLTTAVRGGWKTSQFTWPVWSAPAPASVVQSVLALDLEALSQAQRSAAGIEQVFAARILRSDQGGYGSFTPARVVPAAEGATKRQPPERRTSAGES